ncbi:MAG: hypothetical protein ACTHNW_03680 [Mucilaginibacter sp.]
MEKLWAKKLRRGCAIPTEEQAFEGQRPVRQKSLSSGLIFCYFFIKKKVVASAAMSGENDR